MTLSLNEIDALAKKAARGAGYPWGLAEEVGPATRWLYAHGFDAAPSLVALLQEMDGKDLRHFRPLPDGSVWRSTGETLCPICAGATFLDRVDEFGAATSLEFVALKHPLYLLPFAAIASVVLNCPLTLRTENAVIVVNDGEVSAEGGAIPVSGSVVVARGGAMGTARSRCDRASLSEASMARLNDFAGRTYAPATEESRALGAGSSGCDND